MPSLAAGMRPAGATAAAPRQIDPITARERDREADRLAEVVRKVE
jgi:hypothetical protein